MDIYDFVGLLTDDSAVIAVYDYTAEDEVFCGEARDVLYEDIRECEVLAVDICAGDPRGVVLILNIETEAEEE